MSKTTHTKTLTLTALALVLRLFTLGHLVLVLTH